MEAAPGSYKTNLSAANNTVFINQQDWDRSIGQVGRALAILDNLPDLQNAGIAYQQAGVFYRNLGIRLASANPAGRAGTGPEYWYRKSLNALLRSEKIELAQDERNRAENAKRGKPGLTFVPSALYLHMGRTYQKLGDPGHALEAFERGRALGIRSRPSGRTGVGVSRGRRHSKSRHGAGGSPGGGFEPDATGVETGGVVLGNRPLGLRRQP